MYTVEMDGIKPIHFTEFGKEFEEQLGCLLVTSKMVYDLKYRITNFRANTEIRITSEKADSIIVKIHRNNTKYRMILSVVAYYSKFNGLVYDNYHKVLRSDIWPLKHHEVLEKIRLEWLEKL